MGTDAKVNTNPNARPQMTPRERQRMTEKKRKKRKRRLILVVVSFSLVIAAAVTGLVYGFFTVFRITGYQVEGGTTYTAEQVFETSGLKLQKNLFFSNTKDAKARIETMLPYIGSAEIKRKMPGTLILVLTETQAAAMMQESAGYLLLDKDGKALERKIDAVGISLPVLLCPAPVKSEIGHTAGFEMQAGAIDNPLEIY